MRLPASFRAILAACLLLTAWCENPITAADTQVYDQVMAEFVKHDQRLPGSLGWTACADALTTVLAAHGVELKRQAYQTAVPQTVSCSLTIDGVSVPGIFPLGPNGIAPTTTWGAALSGEIHYLGDGASPRLNGTKIKGSIALLDFGSPAMADVFALGAQAVIFVDHPGATQWSVANHFTDLALSVPRAWMRRADAEKAGLLTLEAGKSKIASLQITTRWVNVSSANLWAMIPAAADTDAESATQTIVLSAPLGTFGAVPDCAPQQRWAANCALLADTAARLQAERPKRNILVVFIGSTYAAQDGARVLYWVVNKTILGSRDQDPLVGRTGITSRIEKIQADVDAAAERLKTIADPGFIASGTNDAFVQTQRVRQILVGMVNNLNYDIRTVQLERHRLEGLGKGSQKAMQPADPAKLSAIDARDAQLKARKLSLNELRRQVHEQHITDPSGFSELTNELSRRIIAERDNSSRLVAEAQSSKALFEVLADKAIIAHFDFDFSSATSQWLVNPFIARSMACLAEPSAGLFVKQARACQLAFDALPPEIKSAKLFSPDNSVSYQLFNLCTPMPVSRPSAPALALGIFGAELQTMGDALNADELPNKGSWNLAALAGQSAAFVRTLSAREFPVKTGLRPASFYDEKMVAVREGSTWRGLRLVNYSKGSEEIEGTAEAAAVFIQDRQLLHESPSPEVLVGSSPSVIAFADAGGFFFSPSIVDEWTGGRVNAFGFNADGVINRATVRGASTDFQSRLFYAQGGGFLNTFLPESYLAPSELKVLDARLDSETKHQLAEASYAGQSFFVNHDRRIKLFGQGLLLLNRDPLSLDPRERDGRGLLNSPAQLISTDMVAQCAIDYADLNHKRMEVLRSRNLINKPVERLQADADEHLAAAQESRLGNQQSQALAHDTAAAILGNRAYRPLRDIANDLLRAVVILLVLSIPFAFAAERLAIGAASIYGQIAGFIAIFGATFVVLYFTHPAFALASAPIVIFLAFVIILLSAFVIGVVMGKFKQELKAMQGLASKAHGAEGGGSTTFAAIIIGISGMRNRPLKTFLTVTTVALLTFTILVFASFESTLGIQETYLGKTRGPERIEIHTPSFQTVPERLQDTIANLFDDRFVVYRRMASFKDPANQGLGKSIDHVLWNPAEQIELKLDAVLSLDPREAEILKTPFTALAGERPLYLSKSAAKHLNALTGSTLMLRGMAFTVVGTFVESDLQKLENIDGTRLVPPNFDSTFQSLNVNDETAKKNLLSSIDPGMFIFCQPGQVAITTPAALAELGAVANFISLYPKPGTDVVAAAQELAPLVNAPIFATNADGAKRYFYTSVVSGSGYAELIVPLLLGGLIIFSSLLGSIVDRQKEIFTFSALGLAPKDVGTLFFAESAVIAVLGGMGGYLISQILVTILVFLADHGLASVPNVNFSSSSSLITILIVMMMVMLSTIYPALMASRSANPGVNRSWKMPKPDGDVLSFTFPFTVPEKSFAGILGFIREHFENHGDASLDVFSARKIEVARVPGDAKRLGISAHISLAPFDLGVLQRLSMHTRPSDIPGIDEVVVELTRLNGAPGTWLKTNRVFIEDLRNQFLIWRSLPPETVEHYQRTTAESLATALNQSPVIPTSSSSTGEVVHG